MSLEVSLVCMPLVSLVCMPPLSAVIDLKNWLSLCAFAVKMKRTSAHLKQQRKDSEAGCGGGSRQKEAKGCKGGKGCKG